MVAERRKRSKATKAVASTEAAVPVEDDAMPPLQQQLTAANSTEPVLVQEDGSSLGESLFHALTEGASAEQVVVDLLRIYGDGSTDTVCCAVLNLVGKVSGVAQAELDASALKDDVDVTTLLEEMYARVPEDAAVYPLVRKDPKFRSFFTAYRRFFGRLVGLSYTANVLLDGVLLPTLLRWLIAMSESKARCFRHTSTVALLSIVGALNGLIHDLNHRLPPKGRGRKQQVGALQESIHAIAEMRNHVISQAIHQRPRDVAPEIRLLVFEHLEDWILKYDDEFAENKYFRYFGMALYDKRPEIRAEALTMIRKALAATPESGNRMFLFLQYFSNRLVEMCSDVSMRCAELAIGVIVLILRVYGEEAEGKELLDNEKIDRVLLTLFDERPTIRREAGILLRVFIDSRVSVDASSGEAAYQKAATELLCAFAGTLRSQYEETMPERYLIDALYTPSEDVPHLLQVHTPLLELAADDDAAEAVVGLSLVAALLEKARGRLDLGPVPREDRRHVVTKKLAVGKQEAVDAFVANLSRDAGVLLAEVLEKHRGDVGVLCSIASVVAAMDLKVFTSLEQVSRINALMVLLRKATAALPRCEELQLVQITSAWTALAFEDHPFKSEANGHLQELKRQVFKQLAAIQKGGINSRSQVDENELLHVCARLSIVSSLVSLVDHWGTLKTAIVQHTVPTFSPEILRLTLASAVRCVLWQIGAEQQLLQQQQQQQQLVGTPAAADTISQMIGELLTCIFQAWALDSQRREEGFTTLLVDSMIHLCDLCALKYYTMSQVEQDALVTKFGELTEMLSSEISDAKAKLKDAQVHFQKGGALSVVTKTRRELSRLEASQLRMTVGIVRLLLLNRLAGDVAPRVLLQWTHAPTKAIADVFRCLFRTLRDRDNDSFTLEKSILVAAYSQSSEALYQMGLKLSSMHWPLPDKYYTAVVSLVRFGIDFAITTDPVMLQAVVAYCPKLLRSDALGLAHSLAANPTLAESEDPNARLFVAAIRRAAKLEETVGATPIRSVKRPRDASHGVDTIERHILQQQQQEGGALVASPTRNASRMRSQRLTTPKAPLPPNRVVTAEGWHVRPDEIDNEAEVARSVTSSTSETVEATRGRQLRNIKLSPGAVAGLASATVTATQETLLSSMAGELDRDEVFIATQEYD
ncbi:cohesin complex subunit SA-1/2 [Trypanosoma grayi]|uniref:cohesin complex subunit SA-1/2 n=1 Tax=Trypanosoma grayi TaxID=71804 RepID=UPI0004F49CEF|nr:cohesin complex subunit SA-1/2 [Trypanosoma grayi]KEG11391.1 cohesin complex subunit SA-1/2 [Trypanosoma grayi]